MSNRLSQSGLGEIYICVMRNIGIGTIPDCPGQSRNSYFVRRFRNCTGQYWNCARDTGCIMVRYGLCAK